MYLNISSRPLYTGVALIALVNICWLIAGGITLDFGATGTWAAVTAFFLAVFVYCRKLTRDEAEAHNLRKVVGDLFEGLFFLQVAWINLRILNHLSMTTALPFADDLLLSWDRALGIDWLGYFEWVHAHPTLITLLDKSYTTLTFLSVLALTGLIMMKQTLRARYFIEAFFVTAVLCVIVGAFFPAKAAVVTLLGDPSVYTNFPTPPGVYHMDHLMLLRDPTASLVLHPANLPGLVTFPSFHTAAGVLLAIAYWRTPAFLPVAAYSFVMICSTPVFGGHYFIDILAGALVACVIAALLAARPRFRSLFEAGTRAAPASAKTTPTAA